MEDMIKQENEGLTWIGVDYAKGFDPVNSPGHYTEGGIETIDILEAKLTPEMFEGYLVGNVLKYMTRYRKKGGLQDVKKAEWYIKKLAATLEEQNTNAL